MARRGSPGTGSFPQPLSTKILKQYLDTAYARRAPLVGVVVAVDGVPISSDHSSSPTTNVELSDRSVRTPPPGAKTRGQYHSVGTFDENDDDGDVGDNGMPEFGP